MVVALLAAAGCGAGDAASVPPAAAEPDVVAVFAAWDAFPVGARPRPIVPIGSGVEAPRDGFPDSATKEAWLASAIDLPADLPEGPRTAGGLPVLSATEAGRRLGEGSGQPSPTRLVVTGARLGTVPVVTDRGPRRLPAWFFTLRGIRGEASVLAVADPALFRPTPEFLGRAQESVTLHRDGRTLTFRFEGAPPGAGPCDVPAYTVEAVETATVVLLAPRAVPGSTPPDDDAVCDLVAVPRQADVRLAEPLGNRVAITEDGSALPVTRDD